MLTSAGGALSAQTVRFFKESRRHKVYVLAVDKRTEVPARMFADAFMQVPAGKSPGYAEAIAEIATRHDIDLVLPCSDEEALALADARELIENNGRRLACAPADVLRLMADKAEAFEFLHQHGIPTPQCRLARTREQLHEAIEAMLQEYREIAIKPAASRGGRGVTVIRRDVTGIMPYNEGRELHMDVDSYRREHASKVESALPVLVMERLSEPCFDIDVLADAGKALRIVPRQRFNPAGIPFAGNRIVFDSALLDLGKRATAALGISWLYDFDVMSDSQGKPVIIEVNPRPSGSVAACVAAGIPIFDDLIDFAQGFPLGPSPRMEEAVVLPYLALGRA